MKEEIEEKRQDIVDAVSEQFSDLEIADNGFSGDASIRIVTGGRRLNVSDLTFLISKLVEFNKLGQLANLTEEFFPDK